MADRELHFVRRQLAVNTGGWKRPDGSVGYFSTVWQRQADGGWKWIVDGGDGLTTPRAAPDRAARSRRASCRNGQPNGASAAPIAARTGRTAAIPPTRSLELALDRSTPDGVAHASRVRLWDGKAIATVIDDKIAARPQ